ncbi:hypothetical protein Tco_1009518, partial [Tanacetum coccineum]
MTSTFCHLLGYKGGTPEGAKLIRILTKIEVFLPILRSPRGAQGVELKGVGTGSLEKPFEPASLPQATPSSAFIKENIEILKTMIKEHDQQAKAKATLKKLAYNESKEGDSGEQAKGSEKPLPWESNITTKKVQETTKLKQIQGKTQEGKNRMLWKEARIPGNKAKLLRNIKAYEGNKDPKDHLSIFSAATKQEEWPMSVWCKMFCQTLGGAARNWFDDLDPQSVNNFEELSQKFIEEFSQQIGEAAAGSAEIARSLQWDKGNTRTNWSGGQERVRGRNGPREFRRNMGTCAPYSKRNTVELLRSSGGYSRPVMSFDKPASPERLFSYRAIHDLEDLVKTFRIPLDLHPRLPDSTFTMDRLPSDAIGIYFEFLQFFGVHIPFSTFLLSVLKYFKRHYHSFVSDDLPTDGYDRNDVEWLRVHLIRLREIREEMSIYDFMTLPSWGDAKIVEEPHHLFEPVLERVSSHTAAHVAEDALIPLPTPEEVVAAQPDPRLAKKSNGPSQRRLKKRASEAGSSAPKLGQAEGMNEADITDFCTELKDSMERDECTSIRAASVPTPRLGKRLGPPPSMAVVSVFGPAHVGTSAHASTSGRSLAFGGSVAGGFAEKSRAEDVWRQMDPLDALAHSVLSRDIEYDEIPKDDFGTATRGEEIELTLFPFALGPYHMSYPYEGVSSPLYTKEEWDGSHAPESNILCKDIFKDPDVCRKDLDRTINPVELRRTESLLLLELSNRVNVLSALLVSHGTELNYRYTDLVASRVRLQEKVDRKTGCIKVLRSEVTSLDDKHEKVQRYFDALGQENIELHSQRDVAYEEGYKDAVDELRTEDTQFIGSGVEGLVQRLLSSDEFHAALAHVVSLGINYGVERGLRMGRTNADFEAAAKKFSNFHIGAEADFNKAFVAFPTTPFPFLDKVVAAAGGALSKVTQILPDKLVCSATLAPIAPPIFNEASD